MMTRHLSNENGSLMVITLLVMAILTIIGISAINMSNVDTLITINERIYKENFYRAESAANEAVQIIDDAAGEQLMVDSGTKLAWLNDDSVWPTVGGEPDIEDPTNWTAGNSQVSTIDANARYAVFSSGIASGGSIDITAPSQLFEFEVHGQYFQAQRGWSQVVIGYRKRF